MRKMNLTFYGFYVSVQSGKKGLRYANCEFADLQRSTNGEEMI